MLPNQTKSPTSFPLILCGSFLIAMHGWTVLFLVVGVCMVVSGGLLRSRKVLRFINSVHVKL